MKYTYYLFPFLVSFALVLCITPLVRRYAIKHGVLDNPLVDPERKIQKQPVPFLGGLAVYLGFVLALIGFTFFSGRILGGYMLLKHVMGLAIGGFLLMVGGYLDDKYTLKSWQQICWPVLAALTIIASGIGIDYVTNPFGGTIYFNTVKLELFNFHGLPYYLTLWADLLTFLWIMAMVYTTKLLDGLDGLVPGVGAIGSVIIFFLSLTKTVDQPETALIAIILGGALFGFLLFSFYPARIFLGEGGATFVGFMLGVLAIVSGAKIATALLIMGIPLLDVLWVVLRRVFKEKKSPFWADKKHLHFRLLDAGLTHRQSVLFLYFLTAAFGVNSLFLKTKEKLIAFGVLVLVMLILAWVVIRAHRRKTRKNNPESIKQV